MFTGRGNMSGRSCRQKELGPRTQRVLDSLGVTPGNYPQFWGVEHRGRAMPATYTRLPSPFMA